MTPTAINQCPWKARILSTFTQLDVHPQVYRENRALLPGYVYIKPLERREIGSTHARNPLDGIIGTFLLPIRSPKGRATTSQHPSIANLFGARWLLGLQEPFLIHKREEGRPQSNQGWHFWSNSAIKRHLFEQSLQHLSELLLRKACDGRKGGSGAPKNSGLDTAKGTPPESVGKRDRWSWPHPTRSPSAGGCLLQASSLPRWQGRGLSSRHVKGIKS